MSIASFSCLLAQLDGLDSFVSALRDKKGRGDSSDIFTGLLILVVISVLVWLAARAFDWILRKRRHPSPRRLLWSLSRAHRLRWSQWWLLRQIAKQQKLEDPARLFLEPEWLDPATLGLEFATQRMQIQVLRARLFSDLAEMGGKPQ